MSEEGEFTAENPLGELSRLLREGKDKIVEVRVHRETGVTECAAGYGQPLEARPDGRYATQVTIIWADPEKVREFLAGVTPTTFVRPLPMRLEAKE